VSDEPKNVDLPSAPIHHLVDPGNDATGRHVLGDSRAGADVDAAADVHPTRHDGVPTDEHVLAQQR
jgi:hypothetical protein